MRTRRLFSFKTVFWFIFVLMPLLCHVFFIATDPNTSFARENLRYRAEAICSQFGAKLRNLDPTQRHMTIAIPNRLLNDTIEGPYFAAKLFLQLCELGGPDMELWIERIDPEVKMNGAWSPDTKDSGEQWVEDYYVGIPTARNPVTLEWARKLVRDDPFE